MKLPDFKKIYRESVRVLKLTTRPDRQEFSMVAKITGLLIVVLGFVGYIFTSLKHLLGG